MRHLIAWLVNVGDSNPSRNSTFSSIDPSSHCGGQQPRQELDLQQHGRLRRMARQREGQQPQQELDLQHRGRLRRMAWPAWQQHREQQLDLQQYRRLRRMDSNSTASSNSTISMDAYVASPCQLGEQ
ncbi:hypothetical protein PF008_g27646 [Phytophthora fragariae]|uniref:Uncharacterized protein n=1 Tax=Phytophthora fragariae TaxID=53985 RepID=A0A6G0QDR5_9STRA|nr:hypothetical protein PF008_g27646 [Phytophthora fragariae]